MIAILSLISLACLLIFIGDVSQVSFLERQIYSGATFVLAAGLAFLARRRIFRVFTEVEQEEEEDASNANTTFRAPARRSAGAVRAFFALPFVALVAMIWAYWPELSVVRGDYQLVRLATGEAAKHYHDALNDPRLPVSRIPDVLIQLGYVHLTHFDEYEDGDESLIEALDAFKKSHARQPDRSGALLGMADAYMALGAYDEAKTTLEQAGQLESAPPLQSLARLAALHRLLGQYEAAFDQYNRIHALEKGQVEGWFYYQRGRTFLHKGSYAEAAEDLTLAVEDSRWTTWVYLYRACAQAYLKNFDAALEDYERGGEKLEEEAAKRERTPKTNRYLEAMARERAVLREIVHGNAAPPDEMDFCADYTSGLNLRTPRERSPLLRNGTAAAN